jgi:hypothetical protein
MKPDKIVEWALNSAVEVRGGGDNKIEPNQELKNNGSLDGSFSLNHLNFLFNYLGLWTDFLNNLIVIKNGNGVAMIKDDYSAFIVAFNRESLSQHLVAIARKNGSLAPTTHIVQNSTLTIGTTTSAGNIPINGATASNIDVLCFNFKI